MGSASVVDAVQLALLLPPAGGSGADLMTGVGQLERLAPALPHPR